MVHNKRDSTQNSAFTFVYHDVMIVLVERKILPTVINYYELYLHVFNTAMRFKIVGSSVSSSKIDSIGGNEMILANTVSDMLLYKHDVSI